MPEVRVRLRADAYGETGVVTKAQILDGDLNTVDRFALSQDHQEARTLEKPGEYVFLSTLPSGRTISKRQEVPPTGADVVLETGQSPHEWLRWPTLAGTSSPVTPEADARTPLTAAVPGSRALRGATVGVWHRLWERGAENAWAAVEWPRESWVDGDGRRWKYQLELDPEVPTAFQIGGVRQPWRITMLPPARHVEILISLSVAGTAETLVSIDVETDRYAAESALAYLANGDHAGLRAVGSELLDRAEDLLYRKRSDPMGAAIGGYLLLQLQDHERLHDWPANFANWISWMPDSAVIHGWQLLSSPDAPNLDAARDRFVEAAARGVPFFSIGLRKLYDALRFFAARDATAEDVAQALESVDSYARATDWTKPHTTYRAAHPTVPAAAPPVGIPSDLGGLEFLAEGSPGDASLAAPFPPDPFLRPRGSVVVTRAPRGWQVTEVRGSERSQASFRTKREALLRAQEELNPTHPGRLAVFTAAGLLQRFEDIE